MAEDPPTMPSLLVRLRDHRDNRAWSEFVDLYAPLIYAYARKRGLQDAAADYHGGAGGFFSWRAR